MVNHHGIMIMIRLFTLASLGSTVGATIAAVLKLVRSISATATGVLAASFLSV